MNVGNKPNCESDSANNCSSVADTTQAPIAGSDIVPGPFDILCGRGRSITGEMILFVRGDIRGLNRSRQGSVVAHPGNIMFRRLLNMHKERYNEARRMQKKEIAKEIVAALRAQQSRFLKRSDDPEAWHEVTEGEAIDKVCHSLRRREPSVK